MQPDLNAASRGAVALDGVRLLVAAHDLSLSGAPLIAFWSARELAYRGADVMLAAADDGPLAARLDEAGLSLVVDRSLFAEPERVRDLLQRCDVLVANTVHAAGLVVEAKRAGCACVWHIHESEFGVEALERAGDTAREAIRYADIVVVPSERTMVLYRNLAGGARVELLRYGISDPRELVGGSHRARESDRVEIVHVGSVEPRKGGDVLLRAVASLPDDSRDRLSISFLGRVLDAEFEQGLRRLIEQEDRARVRVLGELPHAETLRTMGTADIFVCSAWEETGPLVVLEAMGLSLPVVSTRVGTVDEIVDDGIEGYVIAPGDVGALAGRLDVLLEDERLRREMGRRGRTRFERDLTIDRYGDQLGGLVRRAVAVSPLTRELLAADVRIGELERTVAEARTEADALRRDSGELEHALEEVRSSRSWRLGARAQAFAARVRSLVRRRVAPFD